MSMKTIVKLYDAAECRMRCPGKLIKARGHDRLAGCGSFDWHIARKGSVYVLRCSVCDEEFKFDTAHPPMFPSPPEWWAIDVVTEEIPE